MYRNSEVRARGGWNGDAHAVYAQQLTRKCTIRVAQTNTKTKPDPSPETVVPTTWDSRGHEREMIQINAKQQKLQFVKNGPVEYRYVMHVNQYSKLSESKVLDEASAHSGIGKGALKGAWDAIGDVIRAWVTE